MTRLINTGWELQSVTGGIESTASSGSLDISTTVFRSGLASLRVRSLVSGTAKGQRFNFLTSPGNGPYFFRVYFRLDTSPSAANTIIQCNDTNAFTTQVASVEINNDRTLQLRDEDGTIGSPSSAIPLTDFEHYIEFKIDLTGGAGSHVVEARLDGSAFATASNRSLSAGILTFNVGGNLNAEAQTVGEWYFDDLAINDSTDSFENSYPGAGELIFMRTDGDSGTPQWTRGGSDSGANWSQLDETTPNGVTDYVTSNTLDQVDKYTMVATPAAMASDDVIKCVTAFVQFAADNSSGSDPDIEVGLEMGGNTDVSAAIDVTSTNYFSNVNDGVRLNVPLVLYNMPGASTTPITKADLDGMLFRLRQAASDTHFARVSFVGAYVEHKPNAGTTYFQSASGGITPSGALTKTTGKLVAGALTPTGAVVREILKIMAGSATPTGALLKIASKILSGSLTSSGTVSPVRTFAVSVGGALTMAGTLIRQAAKSLAGSITPSGSLEKSTSKSLGGALTSSGALTTLRTFLVSVGGTLTMAGTLVRQTLKNLAGNVTPIGNVIKSTSKSLGGALTPSGALATIRTFVIALGGTLTMAGALIRNTNKSLLGTLTSAGSLTRSIWKGLSGALTLTGVVSTLHTAAGGIVLGIATLRDYLVHVAGLSNQRTHQASATDSLREDAETDMEP